jgi:hypothetical protein
MTKKAQKHAAVAYKIQRGHAGNAPLVARFNAKLAASLLDHKDARLMGLELSPVGAQANKFHLNASTAGFVIPYFDAAGKPTGEARFRALWNGKFNADIDKAQRYCSPAGSGVDVYFPKQTDWKHHLASTDNLVVITEGELKAN